MSHACVPFFLDNYKMVTFLWSQQTRFWWHNKLNRVLQLQKPWNSTWYCPRSDLILVIRSSIRLFHREEGETRLFRKFPGRWAVVDAVSCPLSTVFGQKTKKTGGSDRRKGEERVGWERGERKGGGRGWKVEHRKAISGRGGPYRAHGGTKWPT